MEFFWGVGWFVNRPLWIKSCHAGATLCAVLSSLSTARISLHHRSAAEATIFALYPGQIQTALSGKSPVLATPLTRPTPLATVPFLRRALRCCYEISLPSFGSLNIHSRIKFQIKTKMPARFDFPVFLHIKLVKESLPCSVCMHVCVYLEVGH